MGNEERSGLGSPEQFALGGVWHSHHTYESTGRGPITRQHYMIVREDHRGLRPTL